MPKLFPAAALVLLALGCLPEEPPAPFARAVVIASEDDLVRGPLAHGRFGDFLLENEVARLPRPGR